jgi:hypothetical protein
MAPMAVVILTMRYPKILKIIDWGCFATFIFGAIVVALGFLLGFEVNKIFVGLAVVFGWLAVVVATLTFVFDTVMWFIGKAPWYWRSLSPLNFSFVLLVVALFRYNKDMGFLTPILIVACSFIVAWLLVSNRIYERKLFVFVVVPSFFSVFGYYVPLFLGAMFLIVSIFARNIWGHDRMADES